MPTYEYRCNGCQREFEIQQRMADPDLVHCDECGEDKLEKLISWTSVRSNTYQEALFSANPREAMKGTHAVDLSRPPKPKEKPATPPPAAVTPAEPAAAPPATTTAEPAAATSAEPSVAATASASPDDEDEDDATKQP